MVMTEAEREPGAAFDWAVYDAAVDRVARAERTWALDKTRAKMSKEELDMALHALRRLRSQRDEGRGDLEQLALPGTLEGDDAGADEDGQDAGETSAPEDLGTPDEDDEHEPGDR